MAIRLGLRRVIARENLRRAERGLRPLTQRDIAQGVGTSQSAISKLLNTKNKQIDLDTLDGLCGFFQVQPGELFEYTPNDTPPTT